MLFFVCLFLWYFVGIKSSHRKHVKKYSFWRQENGEDNLFNKWFWENWWTTCKIKKLEHFLILYTKLNSKRIKDLNLRPETIKLLEENMGKILSDINHSRILYDPSPRVMEIKAKINKWDLIKFKSFCTRRKLWARWKDSFKNGRK